MTMLRVSLITFICTAVIVAVAHAHGDHSEARQITSYSFSPPFFPDAGMAAIPGWEVRGGTMINTNYIRLTPDVTDKSGFVVARRAAYFQTLELTIQFRVGSEQRKPGADGLAFWITTEPIRPGQVFGGPGTWTGLAVMFDSFDNNGDGTQPSVGMHWNDGTKIHDVTNDGVATLLGQCKVPFRDHPISNVHIYYENGWLHLYHDAMNTGAWTECAGPFEIELPEKYFFAFSAATGGLSDNHDLYSFTVGTMDSPDKDYGLQETERRRVERDENRAQKMLNVKEAKTAQAAEQGIEVEYPPKPPELPKVVSPRSESELDRTNPEQLMAYIERQSQAIQQLELQLQHAGEEIDQIDGEKAAECDSQPQASQGSDKTSQSILATVQRLERSLAELSLAVHQAMESGGGSNSGGDVGSDAAAVLDTGFADMRGRVDSNTKAIQKEIQTLYSVMNNDNRADAIQHDETTRQIERQISEFKGVQQKALSRLETLESTLARQSQTTNLRLTQLSNKDGPSNVMPIILMCVQLVLTVVVLGVSILGGGRRRGSSLY